LWVGYTVWVKLDDRHELELGLVRGAVWDKYEE
jgi:hypothetical protein